MSSFGILSYGFSFKRATNVGDYVQSLAALRFVETADREVQRVNREQLGQWSGGPVSVIMNGWYMHDPMGWPPAADINPLYVSLHINPSVYDRFAREDSLAHLRRHSPIGCRDTQTQEFLLAHGVDAYFSGCLTLTLERERYCADTPRKGVVFCDIAHGRGSFKALVGRKDLTLPGKFARLPRVLGERHSSLNADRLTHKLLASLDGESVDFLTTQLSARLSEAERFNYARESLRRYANARLVVTSRIHVALPCIAFGTPVLFINPDIDSGRFPGLVRFFKVFQPSEVLEMDEFALRETLMNLENPIEAEPYGQMLISTVEEFVRKYR